MLCSFLLPLQERLTFFLYERLLKELKPIIFQMPSNYMKLKNYFRRLKNALKKLQEDYLKSKEANALMRYVKLGQSVREVRLLAIYLSIYSYPFSGCYAGKTILEIIKYTGSGGNRRCKLLCCEVSFFTFATSSYQQISNPSFMKTIITFQYFKYFIIQKVQ